MAAGTNPTDPCAANVFSQLLSGNAIVCSKTFQSYETKSGVAQIQSVADNAKSSYGADSVAAQVAQQTATAQEAQVPADVTDVTVAVGNSSAGKVFGADCSGQPGVDLSFIGGPCLSNTLLKEIGLGILAALALGAVLYVAAVFGPLVPKGRR